MIYDKHQHNTQDNEINKPKCQQLNLYLAENYIDTDRDSDNSIAQTIILFILLLLFIVDEGLTMHQSRMEENSCMQLKQNHKDWPSGYYWVNITGTPNSTYCNMDT